MDQIEPALLGTCSNMYNFTFSGGTKLIRNATRNFVGIILPVVVAEVTDADSGIPGPALPLDGAMSSSGPIVPALPDDGAVLGDRAQRRLPLGRSGPGGSGGAQPPAFPPLPRRLHERFRLLREGRRRRLRPGRRAVRQGKTAARNELQEELHGGARSVRYLGVGIAGATKE